MSGARRLALSAALLLVAPLPSAGGAPWDAKVVDVPTGAERRLETGAVALHVVLFATWCPPCLDELQGLADLDVRWGDRGYRLVIVGVKARHDLARLQRFATERSLPGALVFDSTGELERAVGATGIPTHLVFDRAGREVARSGSLDAAIRSAIEALIRGKASATEGAR
jgi:hypothetical protein